MQAARAKPDCVYVYVLSVCESEGAHRARGSYVCVKLERKMCVVCPRSLLCVCVCVSFPAPVAPVRRRFNKQRTRREETGLYAHRLAAGLPCAYAVA